MNQSYFFVTFNDLCDLGTLLENHNVVVRIFSKSCKNPGVIFCEM